MGSDNIGEVVYTSDDTIHEIVCWAEPCPVLALSL